ncbi:MAG: class I SAM-dependent methyltransferase [Actinomycetota bacterium]|nr:class I SAM-dependent methyltransferase [Actinomycetota bacterium]
MAVRAFDEAKSEAFAGSMLEVLNGAAIALMTSIGHRVGLFDAMADQPPATSHEIAQRAGLTERYVREWLGAMVTGRVVEYRPEDETYSLPPEHAAWLTRAAGLDNLALQAQYVPLLANIEDPLIDSFRNGGGVPYSAYPRFQLLMAEESGAVHDAALIDTILPLVPGLPGRLQTGIEAADVGCGRGHAVNLMAQAFANSHFTGFDFSEEGIAAAGAEAEALGLTNAEFEDRDVSNLEANGRFDLITAFDAIHDQAHPAEVLAGIADALQPNGVFLMVDIGASSKLDENMDRPLAPFLYTVSCMHCMTVSLALDGAGLGTMWGEQKALEMLADAGFTQVEIKHVEGDLFNNYYVATKSGGHE